MPFESPPPDPTPAEPVGELKWSGGLFGLIALAWAAVAVAFYVPGRVEGSTMPWLSDAIWRALNSVIWLSFTPAIFFLAKAFPLAGEHERRNGAVHVAAALALAAAHMFVFLPADHWLDPAALARFPSMGAAFQNQWTYRLVTGSVNYAVVFFIFASVDQTRRARLERYRAEELRRQLAEAQLSALRMQIQPHFLFNTLHSISSLIHEAPSEALTMVSRLGDFLRAALDRGAAQTIPFADELKFAELYLDIERVRFGDRLNVTVEAAPDTLSAAAPTLILQPLVENAIRHGVATAMGMVDLAIVAERRGGQLEVRIRNAERAPDAARGRPAAAAAGLGLANTRARLRQAYGEAASLEVEAGAPGVFQATLRWPVREAADARA